MESKYKKSLNDYTYLLMFDLASKNTGVCLFNIKQQIPVKISMISVKGIIELPTAELEILIDNYFNELKEKEILKEQILVSYEALPSQIRSGPSTIQTFIALAKAHAILDNYLYKNNIDVYDYVGIYPITTHCYLKKLLNKNKDDKVDKEDIRQYVMDLYQIEEKITYDESDAIFLAKTLIDVKWNKDIEEKIKELKKHKKTLKMEHAIKNIDDQINELQNKLI